MKKTIDFIHNRPYKTAVLAAFLANAIIWCLHMRSLIYGVWGMICHPVSALFNALILLGFYSLTLIFKHRIFALSTVSILWLGLGVTDCVLLGMRVEPLQAIDFYIVRTGIAIIGVYMSVPAIILSALGILAAIFLLVLLFIKAPVSPMPPISQRLLAVICILLALTLFSIAFVGFGNADPNNYQTISEGYDAYGFPYCFLRSVFDRGIDKPSEDSAARTAQTISALAKQEPVLPSDLPNVIFVQLESFFDIDRLSSIRFESDPIPNFHALEKQSLHGLLTVPGIGSGTVNTEFEVLTGIPLDFFGTGEYPYESILREKSCETVAYDLSLLGFGTHAMHNHTSSFYDRYRVYANLGFDSFTGSEYMKGITYNSLGWERDEILTSYILKALDSTNGKDFVFAVTVEAHGGYPEIPTENGDFSVTGIEDEALANSFAYYASCLKATDTFIGELVTALKARDEHTLLVLYGDHLPALSMTNDSFSEGDLLTTDYLIYSINGQPQTAPKRQDIAAYHLFPLSFSVLGLENGLVPRIWKQYGQNEDYLNMLHSTAYDSLYGDRTLYGSPFPYPKKNMKLGLDTISLTAVSEITENDFYVRGENFTPDSAVFVNGRRKETQFISEDTLYIVNQKLETGDEISVVQISVDLRKLSETPKYIIKETDFLPN